MKPTVLRRRGLPTLPRDGLSQFAKSRSVLEVPTGCQCRLIIYLLLVVLLTVVILYFSLFLVPAIPNEAHSRQELSLIGEIDVVYLWVNGSDPKLLQDYERLTEFKQIRMDPKHKPGGQRFRQFDELKYSLRSLELYAPWFRRLYLVVAGPSQTPTWLNTSHPKLFVQFHGDIFPGKHCLPTFNSRAIESNIFRLDGLSENFVYFNDDFFLLRPVYPSDFLEVADSGVKHLLYLDRNIPTPGGDDLRPYQNNHFKGALARGNRILDIYFPIVTRHYFRHVPRLLNRKWFAELYNLEKAAQALTETSSHHFRSPEDVHPLHLYFHYILQKYPERTKVVSHLTATLTTKYITLKNNLKKFQGKLNTLKWWPFYKFLCINDNAGDDPDQQVLAAFQEFLVSSFPLPSSFEVLEH